MYAQGKEPTPEGLYLSFTMGMLVGDVVLLAGSLTMGLRAAAREAADGDEAGAAGGALGGRPQKGPMCSCDSKITFSGKQLERKFDKHANDFGVAGNNNKTNRARFETALRAHVDDPATLKIHGTYRWLPGQEVTHYVNPKTGLSVLKNAGDEFISGWRLSDTQMNRVLMKGHLG